MTSKKMQLKKHLSCKYVKFSIAMILVFISAGASFANAEIVLNLANAYGANSIHGEGNVVFAEEVAKKTNGEVKITVHTGGSLGYKSADHFDAVGDGALDIADTPGNFLGGIDPIMLLSSIPFLANTIAEAHILMEMSLPEYEKVFEANGQKLLYASPWPASGIWAKMPIKSVKNLDGLKIRTFDPNGTRAFKAMGASPINLAWADVVPQLATGGISAVLTSAEGGVTQKFVEHTQFFTEINYAVPLNIVHMNKKVFESLSKKNQLAILDAAMAASDRNWDEVIGRTQKNYDALISQGGTVVTDHEQNFLQDLGKAGQVVLNNWIEKTGERGSSVVAEYRRKVKK